MPVLRSGKRVALLVRKPDRATFKVGTVELREGMDDGAGMIAAFQQPLGGRRGRTSPRSSPASTTATWRRSPRIGAMLKLKGLGLDDHDQRR